MEWYAVVYLIAITIPFIIALIASFFNLKRGYFFLVAYFALYFQVINFSLGLSLALIDNHALWTKTGAFLFRAFLRELPDSQPLAPRHRHTLMLFNHVSAADFVLHDLICEH